LVVPNYDEHSKNNEWELNLVQLAPPPL